jgi:hypothetical protein
MPFRKYVPRIAGTGLGVVIALAATACTTTSVPCDPAALATTIDNDNTACDGGGIAAVASNTASAVIIRSNVNGNTATDGSGAGGILRANGTVTLTNSRVRGNAPTNCAGTVTGCVN